MTIEKLLLEVTGFIPGRVYEDRQDYLAATARAVAAISNDDFDALPEAATTWFNAAAVAIKTKRVIPDFPELESEAVERPSEPAPEWVDFPPTKDEVDVELDQIVDDNFNPVPAGEPTRRKGRPRRGKVDRYGITEGTVAHDVAMMIEKGSTMKAILEAVGGEYDSRFSVIRKLRQAGHRVDVDDEIFKLTHKDDA
jgi:hypothetical protein